MPYDPQPPATGSSERELYREICVIIEEGILSGALPEETQIPSTNRLARLYTINPATALKGINLLVERGLLYKKRGIGMFVCPGARKALLNQRIASFSNEYVAPLVQEARRLGVTAAQLYDMIDKYMEDV